MADKPMTVGELIKQLSQYKDHEKVSLWTYTKHHQNQETRWRTCDIGEVGLLPDGPSICQKWEGEE